MSKKVLIIGGVAGGASAAARLRRLDEEAQIILFERGEYISFANCGLPYYLSGVIPERESLLVQTVRGMALRFNIDIRVNSEVTLIDREKKEVEVVTNDRTYRESYDFLILSPGAEPLRPPIEGIDSDNIFTLRNMEDVDRIKKYLVIEKPQKAAVIGGGYIGIEMAENLHHAGIKVTLIEAAEHILAPFDREMARIIEKVLIDQGVNLIVNDKVQRIKEGKVIELQSGEAVEAQSIVLSVGIKAETTLARAAGLAIGNSGGIKVDPSLRTSDPAIYAVGDAIEVEDLVNGSKALIPLAGPANKQGRIAADNICGRHSTFKGTQGTSIIKVFDFTAAATGNNERKLRQEGIPYVKSYTHSGSHAGYYPGSTELTIKLLFSPEDGKLLGAQIVGQKGVDKRIDVLATALRHGLTVYDLEELELAYAPPYSSAKDPVNMAGFVAANILRGDVKIMHWEELTLMPQEERILIDVRTAIEFRKGHIEGALNIPVDKLRKRIDEIPRDRKVIVYCKAGLRAYLACRILEQKGYEVYNISGGYDIYLADRHLYGQGLDMNEQMTDLEG
ncbi:CoA-disulfide reductase [Heliorestis acidaminivorans]|uniref:CoA-disulfide reductase n=1 Tax=Heliorestis acidaminivorans TaxID=553427 RepID=A0A6I0F435_9FIRM|nr:FAD-dependent oxidoreductase [Heliorestis acidaminivorans]KAB2954283.1 CoA-disulfide reductase [Heliorestis acidaminivorans]